MESQYPNDDGKGSSMMCRQSSTRWTPTTEQIRILKDLYYNNGVRSPNSDQIQKISAKLRQYGKIEGKNVFYWFQNHKARERQKKRLTADLVPMQMPRSSLWKNTTDPPQESSFYPCNKKYPNNNNITSGAPSSSAGLVGNYDAYGSLAMEKGFRQDCSLSAAGFNGGNGHGSLAMEKSFRQDCSLSAGFNGGNGQMCSNFVNISPQPPYPFFDQYRRLGEDEQYYNYQQEEGQKVQEIETLPLFPMHGDEDEFRRFNRQQQQQQHYPTSWYQYPINGCSRASLELTLNSYGAGWSNNS